MFPAANTPRFRNSVLGALAGFFTIAVAVNAFAQEGDKDKDKDSDKDKGKKAKVQKVSAGGPTLQYEQFRRRVEMKVAEKREEQIQGLQRLLGLGTNEAEVPDIKFRLAELYFEKSQYYFFRGQEADDKAAQSSSKPEKDNLLAEKDKNTKESKAWAGKARDAYKEIRDKYPKYQRMPEVLFALGQSYWSEGRFQDAVEVYAELIRNYKDSPLVAEAWIAFGEFYFNQGDVAKALKSYEKAAEDKRSRVYGFALYKQAWCYYNISDFQQALRKFKATVYYSQMANELSGENKIALGREAQKDYVRTYAHVGEATKAKFHFADLLGSDDCSAETCLKLLEQLATIWYDGGFFAESAHIYRELIRSSPKNTRNAFFQGRIVDLVSREDDKPKTIAESRRLIDIYQTTKAGLATLTGSKEQVEKAQGDVKEAEELAETTIRKLAQVWNREAKKTRRKETYQHAHTMYQDYLSLFPTSKSAYEMRFQLADLYYKLEKFDEAAKAYEATVLADPKGQYLIDAANDNILALEELIKDKNIKKPKTKDGKPVPVDSENQRLIDACDRYVKFVPEDKATKLVAVKFKAGKIYYDYYHYELAIQRFEEIVTTYPSSKQAEYAANLVIDVQNERKEWQALYDTATRYQQIEALIEGRDQLKADLAKYREYAKFSLAQILEERVKKERGDVRLVAQAYEAFYVEFPKSENADKALFNASVAFDQSGEKEKADQLRRQLLKEYKDSPLAIDVAHYIAKRYEEVTDYKKAAGAFKRFAERYPTDSRAADAMFNASVFYAGTGDVKTATKLRTEYLDKYGKLKGKEAEAAKIYYSIALDLDRNGNYKDAAQRYAEYAKKFAGAEDYWDAMWREAQIRKEKLGQRGMAEKIEQQILGNYRATKRKGKDMPPNAARYASIVAFSMIDKDYDKYRRIRIVTPSVTNPRPFQNSLKEKAQTREKMIKQYTSIVTDYQQAESTIAALFRIAQSWDEFVEKVVAVPCPRGVPDEACQLIKQGIEEIAAPARQGAFAAYQTCVAKSNELNTFTDFSTKCVKALEVLDSARYPEIVEKVAPHQPSKQLGSMAANSLILDFDGFGAAKDVQASNTGAPNKTDGGKKGN